LTNLSLPQTLPQELSVAQVWQMMQSDKKMNADGLRYVVLAALGQGEIAQPKQVDETLFRASVVAI
jgi:3-dehydroquinate synthetase